MHSNIAIIYLRLHFQKVLNIHLRTLLKFAKDSYRLILPHVFKREIDSVFWYCKNLESVVWPKT